MKPFAYLTIISICLFQYASSHGKEETHVPNLSADALKLLAPKAKKAAPEEVTQSVATCYQGYTLMSDGTCVKTITEEPNAAEGDITVPYITRCPTDYVAINGECTQTHEVPLAYFCPTGFEDDGTSCSQTIPGEVVTSCTLGELVNGVCVVKERAPHLVTPTCPEGSQAEKDGNCWKVVGTFDCTPTTGKEEIHGRVISAPKSKVPLGKKIVVSKGKESYHLRALHPQTAEPTVEPPKLPYAPPSKHSVPGTLVDGKEHPTSSSTPAPLPVVPTACPGKEFVSVSPPRPTKVTPVSQTCAKKVIVDAVAIVTCPEGFEDFGDACGKETTSPPVTLCLSNGKTEGACPPYVRHVPKIVQCSNGKQPVDEKCVEFETVAAENVCAEGFKDTGNGCTARVKSGGLECRPGLKLVGDKCVGKSVRPSVEVTLKPPPGCDKY